MHQLGDLMDIREQIVRKTKTGKREALHCYEQRNKSTTSIKCIFLVLFFMYNASLQDDNKQLLYHQI